MMFPTTLSANVLLPSFFFQHFREVPTLSPVCFDWNNMAFHLLGLWPPPILEARKLHWTAREPWSAPSAQAPALWAPGGSSCFHRWNDCSNRSVQCQDQWSGQELQCWGVSQKNQATARFTHKHIQTCITVQKTMSWKKYGTINADSQEKLPSSTQKTTCLTWRCEKNPVTSYINPNGSPELRTVVVLLVT